MTPHQLALTGMELKEQGIASLERHRWVDRARVVAEWICRHTGAVTSDDVHIVMRDDIAPHPNCYGAIWSKGFRWTGEYVKSKRPEAHYRDIKVWRLSSELGR